MLEQTQSLPNHRITEIFINFHFNEFVANALRDTLPAERFVETMYFLYSYFQGLILKKNTLTTKVGMLGDMFLWLEANLN